MKLYMYKTVLTTMVVILASCADDEKKSNEGNLKPVSVKVNAVQSHNDSSFLAVSGKVQATNSANLSTRMMGFINKIHVNVGDKVKKGQLLVSVNNSELKAKRAQVNAKINEAISAYENAQKDYNRFKNLFADNSASQKELDDMTANFETAKARLEGANELKNEINAQFRYADITAPFSGVITNEFIKVGDMASPGMPLIAMESLGEFEVETMVPESEISQIKHGTRVDVLVKSIDRVIKGKISEVSTSAKNTGSQYIVKVILDDTDSAILSGMFATVHIPVTRKTASNRVLIPIESIVKYGQLSGVYTVSHDNTALLRWLRLGRTFGDHVEVLSGISINESYIISAQGKLYNGVKISIQ